MLSSARVGVRLRASGLAPALPALPVFAESSRQAELRAVDQIHTLAPGRLGHQPPPSRSRGYAAAAVALNKEVDGPSTYRRQGGQRIAHYEDTTPDDRPPPPPPPERNADRLTGGERFRRRVQAEPVEALLSLNDMSRADLVSLHPKDLLTALYFITKQVKPSPQLETQFDSERVTTALQITRALLHARPTMEASRARDAGLGSTLHGKALRALLRTGVLFGARQFVVDLFAERMDEQAFSRRRIVDTDGLAVDLAASREWKLATTIFAGPSELTPREVYTPRVVAVSMSAHLCTNKPWEAVRLFELFDADGANPKVEAEARCGLVRAQLLLGDIASAQAAVHSANHAGIDTAAIQLAMLRGYRMLGYDADVERRVRQDLARLGLPPQPAVLNAFVWLRLDADDLDGAEAILQELERQAEHAPLDPETSLIAITIASRRGDVVRVRRVWQWLNSRPSVITDDAVAHLCRALGRLGSGDEAIALLRAAIHGGKSAWPLPSGFKPGVLTANAVLDVATRTHKYRGLVEVSQLMHEAGITPDERTLILVLEFASRNLVSSPAAMAKLFKDLLQRTNSTATVDQLNVVLTRVLRVATRDPLVGRALLAPPSGATPADPASGIQLRGKVHRLLAEQIALLRASGQRSTGLSLSNRLIYDALALDGMWPVPAIQKTWQGFVLRGFRPTPKHYASLLAAYVRIGAMEEAEDVLRHAAPGVVSGAGGLTPLDARRMLTQLVTGWARVGDLDRARACYDEIRTRAGPDATALEAIVYAHVLCGQPAAAVAYARRDLARVDVDEGTVVTVAHAIRRANDVPGCIFFVANYTQRGGVEKEVSAKDGSSADSGGQEVEGMTGEEGKIVKSGEEDGSPAPTPHWTLTPRLLAVVRKAHAYLKKQPVSADERVRDAMALAQRMVADDEASRPPRVRRKPTLSLPNLRRVGDLFGEAERRDVRFAHGGGGGGGGGSWGGGGSGGSGGERRGEVEGRE